MPIEIAMLFAWMLLIVFLALIACMFEDLESDTGSQSNPNATGTASGAGTPVLQQSDFR